MQNKLCISLFSGIAVFSLISFGQYLSLELAFGQSDPAQLMQQNIEKYRELGEKGFKQDCISGGVPESLCESLTKIMKDEVDLQSEGAQTSGNAASKSLTTEAVPGDNWTTYTNNEKGISFGYPSDWEVEEKQDRFETAADVSVTDGSAKFFIVKLDNAKSKLFKSFGLADSVKALEEAAARDGSTNIIEETDVTKYKIGGERTGTFLYTKTDETDPYALQIFIVLHDGKAYSLGFRESTSTFDDPETQSTLNKILQSFKFLT